MSARVLVVFAALCVAAPARAGVDSLAGHWEGAYGRLGSIQIVHVDLAAQGDSLAGTYDIPELRIEAEPLRAVRATAAGLTLELTYGSFDMRIAPEGDQMTGMNARWNPPVTLHLKRAPRPDRALPRAAPLAFENGGARLEGTLVLPEGPGPHPAIVIVHGSGAQSRASGFYRGWGAFFARRGVAALIYDKRGVGASSGDFSLATFEVLAGDVRAAVRALRGRPDVDARRIGLFGISQGGWIAPLAAARGAEVAFLILDVGPAVSVRDQELHRVEYTMKADEAAAADIDQALLYVRDVFDAAYGAASPEALFARAESVRAQPWAKYIDVAAVAEDLAGWRHSRYDPAPVLSRTRLPLLALFGENDVLVPPAENAEPMRRLLERAGNTDVTIHVIPGATHDMETFGRLHGGEWKWPEGYWVWARRAPGFEATISAWLRARGLGP
jgi:pimeloyl-ACP methyl ester carboxylesterase